MEGFWTVQYEGLEGNGGGVVVLSKGHVYGGDSGYHYTGTYVGDGQVFRADILVHEFLPGTGNVLGIEGDFRLRLNGIKLENEIKGTAELVDANGAGLAFKLKKISNLSS